MNIFQRRNIKHAFACFILLYLSAGIFAEAKYKTLDSALTDERENHTITLTNGITVVLISDTQTEKSSIGLSIPTGSFLEPLAYPGIARLHQKMLINSSMDYKPDNGISRILASHKGVDLSNVQGSVTSFSFSIDHSMYKGLLDRVVDSFSQPSFSHDALSTKIKGLHSSWYQKKKLPEQLRYTLLTEHSGNPHIAHFSLGNLSTLKANDDLVKALNSYHNDFFSSENIKIIMLSPKPINDMINLAQSKLAKITKKQPLSRDSLSILNIDNLGGKYFSIHSSKPQLFITLPLGNIENISLTKTDALLKRVVLNDQKGTFTRWLTDNAFITNTDMQLLRWSNDLGFLEFSFDLSPKGIKAKENIIQAFFSNMRLIKNADSFAPNHQELSDILKLESLGYKPPKNAEYVDLLVTAAQYSPLKHLLLLPHFLTDFSQEEVSNFIDNIDLENAIIFDHVNNDKLPEKHKFFTPPYSVKPLASTFFSESNKQDFTLPSVNKYIPSDFSLKSAGQFNIPTPFSMLDNIETYYMSSQLPNFPMGSTTVYFNHPQVAVNHETYLKNMLFTDILKSRSAVLNAHAGNAINELFISSRGGLKITISGIPEKQHLILSDLFSLIPTPITPEELTQSIAKLNKKFKKRESGAALEAAYSNFDAIKHERLFSSSTANKQLSSITIESLHKYTQELLSPHTIRMFTYGSYSKEQISDMNNLIKDSSLSSLKPVKSDDTYRVYNFFTPEFPALYQLNEQHPGAVNAIFDCHIDSDSTLVAKAAAIIFVMLVRSSESKKASLGIKDNQILISYRELNERPALGFSSSGGEGLIPLSKTLDLYKKEIFIDFERMNKYSFEELKKEIVSQIEQTVNNLQQDIDYHMGNWVEKTPEDKNRITVIKTIERVTLQDVKSMYSRLFRENKGSRILIQEMGEKNTNKDKRFRKIKDSIVLTKE